MELNDEKALLQSHLALIDSDRTLARNVGMLAEGQSLLTDMMKQMLGIVHSVSDSQKEMSKQIQELSEKLG